MVEMDETASHASAADSVYAFCARFWKRPRTQTREKPQRRRMGTVAEQTRPSFQPMMLERVMADTIVVISWRIAPRTAPLIPARSVVDLVRREVSVPGAWRG
jgi:hypothetical protein